MAFMGVRGVYIYIYIGQCFCKKESDKAEDKIIDIMLSVVYK